MCADLCRQHRSEVAQEARIVPQSPEIRGPCRPKSAPSASSRQTNDARLRMVRGAWRTRQFLDPYQEEDFVAAMAFSDGCRRLMKAI
ncbi:MAG: hypothetical protein EBZ81_03825 [Betaproteobacteria bacterium]|nr:hypothetical protein [Betaproteobacteria bacterium]